MHTNASDNQAVHEPHNLPDAARRVGPQFMSSPCDTLEMISVPMNGNLELNPLAASAIEATQQALAPRMPYRAAIEARTRQARVAASPPGTKPGRQPGGHELDTGIVEWMLRGARAHGRDIEAILRRAGLEQGPDGAPDGPISTQRYTALVRTLTRVMRDEMWGLCDEPVLPGTFASACQAAIHCTNLKDATLMALSHYRHRLGGLAPRLQVDDGLAHVRFQRAAGSDDRLADVAQIVFALTAMRFAGWLVGRRIPLHDLSFKGATSSLGTQAPCLIDVPCRYREAYDGFSFDARWLQLPIMRTAGELRQFLLRSPDGWLLPCGRQHGGAKISDRVRTFLHKRLSCHAPSMEEVARALNLSPTSLSRRLQVEGIGFQDVKDGLRRDVSIQYLRSSRLSLDEIAYRVGFSEPATFCRAFKKWTGATPTSFRLPLTEGA
ncbi:AraC-like DNA-binding protein [Variovorax boronicumulans]|uniref:AraC family transcriptional regulator n=1 Tax=Variovorax boronicumulans TaxID=436515 RepID=UPI00277D712F|nr:AraC family transcriptional regulator [Variovorax boronicumulans]MDP9917420.1 AraC-like DNA-binding protein [Variovorax boronicumulans]